MRFRRPLTLLRFDQVGSLLRPQALKDAHARLADGRASEAELRQAEDAAVRAVVAKQEALDLPLLTDGEFRRVNFQDSFTSSVTGFAPPDRERRAAAEIVRDWNPGFSGPVSPGAMVRRPVVERIRLARNLPLEEYRFSRALTARPVKVTLISPDRVIQRFAYERSRQIYPEIEGFVEDLIRLERQMVAALVEAGCPYIQIDAPSYTAYVDPPSLAQMRARGEDPHAAMERSIRADNAVIAEFPGVTFGVHVCRGNQADRWHREGHYDAIAERLFGTLQHQRLLLEYDSDEAGRYLSIEQLAISPQCGFASDIAGNPLGEEDQWRKLEVVRNVAAEVWG